MKLIPKDNKQNCTLSRCNEPRKSHKRDKHGGRRHNTLAVTNNWPVYLENPENQTTNF